jgi:pyruvate,water dikinase
VVVPPVVERAILAAWRIQGERLDYAVRSSATVEDALDRSFAGQFDSSLNVQGGSPLLAAVRQCWLSLFSPRALAYFARERLSVVDSAMAVVVQQMVPAEVAGVIFTVDPVSGHSGRLVIEGAEGLGERLVSGDIIPETIVLKRPSLRVVHRRLRSSGSCMDDLRCRQLGRLALKVESLFERPMDIEWAVTQGRVHLLQARPVTTTPRRRSWEERQVWTNVNTGEVMPDVMTPVTWSVIHKFVGQLGKSFFRLAGADVHRAPLVGRIGGRLYFSVNTGLAAMKPFERLLRGLPRLEHALGGAHLTTSQQDLLDLPDEDLPDLGFGWVKYILSLPGMIGTLIAHSPRRGDAWTAQLKTDNDARVGEDYASLSVPELGHRLRRLLEEGFRGWDLLYLGTQGVAPVIFEKACRDWLDDPDLKTGYRLFSGLGGMPETEAGLTLWRLALLAHADEETEAVIREEQDWGAVQARLDLVKEGRRFLEAWGHFMSEHGHHCRGELELHNARWYEMPDYILGLVRGYLAALDQADPLAARERLVREREQLTAECTNRLRNPLKRWIFVRSLRRAQKLAVNREEWKNQAVRLLTFVRRVLLALGGQLSGAGDLGQSDDIFFLELGEIEAVAAGQADFDVQAVIRRRREEYERNLTLSPPPVVFGRFDPAKTVAVAPADGVESWRGIPVFPGVVTGRARVILRTDDHEQVRPGEILVAPFTDPAWTPYFVTAAAVVMDQGGILSHGSIVAREYGLPAVTNVGDAAKRLRTGDRIQVDGNRGRVTLLEAASTPGLSARNPTQK